MRPKHVSAVTQSHVKSHLFIYEYLRLTMSGKRKRFATSGLLIVLHQTYKMGYTPLNDSQFNFNNV